MMMARGRRRAPRMPASPRAIAAAAAVRAGVVDFGKIIIAIRLWYCQNDTRRQVIMAMRAGIVDWNDADAAGAAAVAAAAAPA